MFSGLNFSALGNIYVCMENSGHKSLGTSLVVAVSTIDFEAASKPMAVPHSATYNATMESISRCGMGVKVFQGTAS